MRRVLSQIKSIFWKSGDYRRSRVRRETEWGMPKTNHSRLINYLLSLPIHFGDDYWRQEVEWGIAETNHSRFIK